MNVTTAKHKRPKEKLNMSMTTDVEKPAAGNVQPGEPESKPQKAARRAKPAKKAKPTKKAGRGKKATAKPKTDRAN